MTIFSRNGSMGGLVTWAKSCLKYSKTRGLNCERQANGASLPIEPRASFLNDTDKRSLLQRLLLTYPWLLIYKTYHLEQQKGKRARDKQYYKVILGPHRNNVSLVRLNLVSDLTVSLSGMFLTRKTRSRWSAISRQAGAVFALEKSRE